MSQSITQNAYVRSAAFGLGAAAGPFAVWGAGKAVASAVAYTAQAAVPYVHAAGETLTALQPYSLTTAVVGLGVAVGSFVLSTIQSGTPEDRASGFAQSSRAAVAAIASAAVSSVATLAWLAS